MCQPRNCCPNFGCKQLSREDAVGLRTTLDLTPPNINVSNPTAPSETAITVLVSLSEAGTASGSAQHLATALERCGRCLPATEAWCKPVRDFADAPSLLEILSAGFSAAMATEPYMATVMLSGEDATVPLVRGTDYEAVG